MVTRSGAGGNMPPAVGVITDRVIAKRPDLEGMMGFDALDAVVVQEAVLLLREINVLKVGDENNLADLFTKSVSYTHLTLPTT